jgi:hypothetical protein
MFNERWKSKSCIKIHLLLSSKKSQVKKEKIASSYEKLMRASLWDWFTPHGDKTKLHSCTYWDCHKENQVQHVGT